MAIPGCPELGARRTTSKRRLYTTVLFLITLGLCNVCLAQSSSSENLANPVRVRVVKFTLEDFSATKLVVSVNLAATASRNVTVDKLALSGLRANSVPIYAAPLTRRFKLRNGITVTLPESLQITLYVRDLHSLECLRRAIADRHVTLDGLAVASVPLNPLARLMLLANHAEVSTELHQQVPFDVPGGPLVSASLVKMLDLADTALKALDSTLNGVSKLNAR